MKHVWGMNERYLSQKKIEKVGKSGAEEKAPTTTNRKQYCFGLGSMGSSIFHALILTLQQSSFSFDLF
jgi:hypothetical protein